jgi:hypothetical protein
MKPEDGINGLSRKVGMKLPLLAAKEHRKAQFSSDVTKFSWVGVTKM